LFVHLTILNNSVLLTINGISLNHLQQKLQWQKREGKSRENRSWPVIYHVPDIVLGTWNMLPFDFTSEVSLTTLDQLYRHVNWDSEELSCPCTMLCILLFSLRSWVLDSWVGSCVYHLVREYQRVPILGVLYKNRV
jgi:hypothetical protein